MSFNSHVAKELIKEDLASKKPFDANFTFNCETCRAGIAQGDEFFFVGGKKICLNCLDTMQEMI